MDTRVIRKRIFFFEQHIPLDYGYVLMVQDESIFDATWCNFTGNNATYGGAIFAWVSTANQLPDKFIKWIEVN